MEIEIIKELNLSNEQIVLLDKHTLLNMMNVLVSNLFKLQDIIDNQVVLHSSTDLIYDMAQNLSNPTQTIADIRQVIVYEKTLFQDLDVALKLSTPANVTGTIATIDNIKTIFASLKLRTQEVLARLEATEQWAIHHIKQLYDSLTNILALMAKNSNGRYRIVYNIANQTASDYFVHLQIDSVDKDTIQMPLVLQDVLRDLLANARKYTQPGGSIHAGLNDDGQTLRLVVKDNGRGIPIDELDKVVGFGVRGSNIKDIASNGGGFGLTKAYFVTKQFGGRLWIDSSTNVGTKITISIPKPSIHL